MKKLDTIKISAKDINRRDESHLQAQIKFPAKVAESKKKYKRSRDKKVKDSEM